MKNKESEPERLQQPPISTTSCGTQSVDPIEVIRSEKGWSEIKEIIDAYENGEIHKIQHLIP